VRIRGLKHHFELFCGGITFFFFLETSPFLATSPLLFEFYCKTTLNRVPEKQIFIFKKTKKKLIWTSDDLNPRPPEYTTRLTNIMTSY
jgi:hypothetical protein